MSAGAGIGVEDQGDARRRSAAAERGVGVGVGRVRLRIAAAGCAGGCGATGGGVSARVRRMLGRAAGSRLPGGAESAPGAARRRCPRAGPAGHAWFSPGWNRVRSGGGTAQGDVNR